MRSRDILSKDRSYERISKCLVECESGPCIVLNAHTPWCMTVVVQSDAHKKSSKIRQSV